MFSPVKRESAPVKKEERTPMRSHITRYGCGQPGVTRAQCQKCTPRREAGQRPMFACNSWGKSGVSRATCPTCKTKDSPTKLNVIEITTSTAWRTKITASFNQIKTSAYLDSGADRTLISTRLYHELKRRGVYFATIPVDIKVATGATTSREFYQAKLRITLEGRTFDVIAISPKGSRATDNLIGMDIMMTAGIIIRPSQQIWGFEDQPTICAAKRDKTYLSWKTKME
jgi:hypothetical protein